MDQTIKQRLVIGDYKGNSDRLWLDSISCTYSQSADCWQSQNESQYIKFETVDNGCDSFIRMSLPNGGFWSIDDKDELVRLLDDFQSRFESKECMLRISDTKDS